MAPVTRTFSPGAMVGMSMILKVVEDSLVVCLCHVASLKVSSMETESNHDLADEYCRSLLGSAERSWNERLYPGGLYVFPLYLTPLC